MKDIPDKSIKDTVKELAKNNKPKFKDSLEELLYPYYEGNFAILVSMTK